MEKYIAAVDLGTKRISVLVGEKTSFGKFHILAHCEAPSSGVEQGEVRNNVQAGNVLKAIIDELRQEGIDITEVYAGVSGSHIECIKKTSEIKRSNPTVEISEEEIAHLKQEMYHIHVDSDRRILDVIPQRYHLDNGYVVSNPVGVCSHLLKVDFCVLTAANFPMELIRRSIEERAGLQVKGLFLSPLAVAEAVLSDVDKNMGVAVVDIGGGTTSVAIYCDDIVRHVVVLSFGGEVITSDIQQGCEISLRYAEKLKRQCGSCYGDLIRENPTFRRSGAGGGEVSFRMLTKIIESRMDEIMESVAYIIQESGYANRLKAGIVLTGGGAKLGELTEFVRYKTGLKARKGELLFITSDSDVNVRHGDYATALGLLIKGCAYKEPVAVEPEPVLVEPMEPVLFPPGSVETVQPPPKKGGETRIKQGIRGRTVRFARETIPGLFDKLFTSPTDNET